MIRFYTALLDRMVSSTYSSLLTYKPNINSNTLFCLFGIIAVIVRYAFNNGMIENSLMNIVKSSARS